MFKQPQQRVFMRLKLGAFVGALSIGALAIGALAPPVLAEAFRWEDSSGNQYYGSTPPSGAQNVTRLQGKSYSKYSSERVTRGYRGDGNSRARIKEQDLPILTEPLPREETVAEQDAEQNPTAAVNVGASFGGTSFGGKVKLTQGRLSVTHGATQEITSCKVSVKNPSKVTAKKVVVTFEFEDGTFVPGSGPDAISASGEAVYFIAPEHLPIQVKREFDGVSYKQAPRPKVMIQSSPEA